MILINVLIGGKINFDDLMLKDNYERRLSYRQSKLANVLFTKELARRMEGNEFQW